ncbi:MAG: T9SS type A sorting domain-containing protein [Chlorobi bacterium]|nr:T9SS type A sorting domain-containing protein [Chlorobiota bacterium]
MKVQLNFLIGLLFFPFLIWGQTSTDSELHLTNGTTLYVENGAHFCADFITVDVGAVYQTEVLNGTCPTVTFQGDGTIILPVELVSFTSEIIDNRVELNWTTATEINNKGFIVERKSETENDWNELGFTEGNGSTAEMHNYSFTDSNPEIGHLRYRLKQLDYDGSYEYLQEIEVEYTRTFTYKLEQNFPNPFNPSTIIKFEIPEETKVTLKIYDVLGNEAAVLVNENKPAGSYSVEFNAEKLSSGFYIYSLRAGNFFQSNKMLLLK